MQSRLETLRHAGIELYFSYVAEADEHYFSSEMLGPPARDLLGPLMAAGERADVAIHPVLGLTTPASEDAGHYQPALESADAPEWALSWPCASWGENHERAVLIAGELIDAYDPPGIHLDHSRYPDADVLADNPCVCERCVAARLEWLGKPRPEPQDLRKPGVAFKELQMRVEFVRSFVESMRGLTDRYGVGLSAAVRARYYEDALPEGQDWGEWCADGLVDLVCPKTWPFSFGQFARLISQHRRLTGPTPVTWLGGIAVQADDEKLPLDEVERRIRFTLNADADGICIAESAALGDDELALLRRVAED
jgi:hypothetical protein